jgi:hypothetical protein
MTSRVEITELTTPWFQVNALVFLPSPQIEMKSIWGLFTHGYTSHKGDCLNWAARLVDNGVPCLIFDQPGHYLGSFHEVKSFEDFKHHAHKLFSTAYNRLGTFIESYQHLLSLPTPEHLILGGHSLGAFTAFKALELPEFEKIKKIGIGIGIGVGQRQATHIFETAFYEKTLSIRRQLVSPALDSKEVFSWLKSEKEQMTLSHQRLHLITGEDDVVVGAGGMEAFIRVLEEHQNIVTFDRPKKLPHHEPGLATAHIYSFLKGHFGWN